MFIPSHPIDMPPLEILIVEDYDDARRALELFLRALGYHVKTVRDVHGVLDLLVSKGERFDLLLSDLHLPDGDGWTLMQLLEDAACRPPQAIAISGWGSGTDIARSRNAGFQAHLVKPVAPETLKAALRVVA